MVNNGWTAAQKAQLEAIAGQVQNGILMTYGLAIEAAGTEHRQALAEARAVYEAALADARREHGQELDQHTALLPLAFELARKRLQAVLEGPASEEALAAYARTDGERLYWEAQESAA